MPIRAERRHLYPDDWKDISHRIRFERAGGRCECEGECGIDHDGRCDLKHLDAKPRAGLDWIEFVDEGDMVTVILTTAHLNHDESDCRDENLKAMCQGCHNRYDRGHRAQTRFNSRHRGQGEIFDEGPADSGARSR